MNKEQKLFLKKTILYDYRKRFPDAKICKIANVL